MAHWKALYMNAERDTFSTDELAIVLSRYELGDIHAVREFPRGAKRAPKLVLETDKGTFLLKRRPPGPQSDVAKVAFTHQIQLSLAAQNFPLPHLLGTRKANNSMLVLEDTIYEMFEYIEGEGYDAQPGVTYHSGHTQGLYHKLLEHFKTQYSPPTGSYHDAKAIREMTTSAPANLKVGDEAQTAKALSFIAMIGEAYDHSAAKVNQNGLPDWAKQIVHGDWHPGNMLFRNGKVVAVIDYDTARYQQRVIDLANGALQFSILGGTGDPRTWPDHLDMDRLKEFVRGYDVVNVVSVAEVRSIPFLMCEALIAEAILPVIATGNFGRFDGVAFLEMIAKKIKWVFKNVETIYQLLDA
jgi:Ser/Thr protein kinase RdoA (MazF antagonist)